MGKLKNPYRDSGNNPIKTGQISLTRGVFSSLLVFYFIIFVSGLYSGSPIQTLFCTYIAGMCGLGFIYGYDLKNNFLTVQLGILGLLVFTTRVIIGIVHYHFAMDDTYFQSNTPTFDYLYDFEWMLNWMTELSDLWQTDGFGSLPTRWFIEKNTWLMPYQALLFYLGDHKHFLNITVVNSLHVMLVATLAARLAYRLGGKHHAKMVFFIAALQPFNLFSSVLARDPVGQFFLILGFLVILDQRVSIKGFLLMLVGVLQMMMLRQIYFIVGMMTIALKLWSTNDVGYSINKFYVLLILCGIGILSYIFLWDLFIAFYNFGADRAGMEARSAMTISQSPLGIVKRLVISMTGPFPWTNMLSPHITGREFILPAILQAIYNVSILMFFFYGVVKNKIDLFSFPNIYVLVFVFSIMGAGLLGAGHVSYVTVASVLLLAVIPRLNPLYFIITYLVIFFIDFSVAFIW